MRGIVDKVSLFGKAFSELWMVSIKLKVFRALIIFLYLLRSQESE